MWLWSDTKRFKLLAAGLLALVGVQGNTLAASATFSGYRWPQHRSGPYQASVTNALWAKLLVPKRDLPSASQSASGSTDVTVKESESWSPRLTMRTGGVKPGGLFVALSFAQAPLSVSLNAAKLGEDAGHRLVMPAFTVTGRLSSQGKWTLFRILTRPGAALPPGVNVRVLLPMAAKPAQWLPPVPRAGWISGQSFIHRITVSPAQLLSVPALGASDAVVTGGPWTIVAKVSPRLTTQGNWDVMSKVEPSAPLKASIRAKVGTDTVSTKVSLTLSGSNQVILSPRGRLKHQHAKETVAITQTTNGAGPSSKSVLPLTEQLSERLNWTLSP